MVSEAVDLSFEGFAILHKQLKLPGSLHRTLQILSVHPFEKIPVHELLTETPDNVMDSHNPNQLWLWQLKLDMRDVLTTVFRLINPIVRIL